MHLRNLSVLTRRIRISRSMSTLSPVESAKRKAAYAAVDEYVADNQVIGIGSGSTVVYAVERLVQRVREEKLNVICIPSSFQAINLINDGGLTLGDLARNPVLDVTIDGADEVDSNLNWSVSLSLCLCVSLSIIPSIIQPHLLSYHFLSHTHACTLPKLVSFYISQWFSFVSYLLYMYSIKGGGGCQTQEKIVAAA